MKFTEKELLTAIEELKHFTTDSYNDGMGEDCESAFEFLKRCAEAVEDFKNAEEEKPVETLKAANQRLANEIERLKKELR